MAKKINESNFWNDHGTGNYNNKQIKKLPKWDFKVNDEKYQDLVKVAVGLGVAGITLGVATKVLKDNL